MVVQWHNSLWCAINLLVSVYFLKLAFQKLCVFIVNFQIKQNYHKKEPLTLQEIKLTQKLSSISHKESPPLKIEIQSTPPPLSENLLKPLPPAERGVHTMPIRPKIKNLKKNKINEITKVRQVNLKHTIKVKIIWDKFKTHPSQRNSVIVLFTKSSNFMPMK